jgi:hypothetical protein
MSQPETVSHPSQLSQSKGVKVLREMYADLTNTMDPEHGLLGHLYSLEVISMREKADIEAQATFFDKNECLLKKLIDQNVCDKKFKKFVEALGRSDQNHISSKLSGKFTELSGVR